MDCAIDGPAMLLHDLRTCIFWLNLILYNFKIFVVYTVKKIDEKDDFFFNFYSSEHQEAVSITYLVYERTVSYLFPLKGAPSISKASLGANQDGAAL